MFVIIAISSIYWLVLSHKLSVSVTELPSVGNFPICILLSSEVKVFFNVFFAGFPSSASLLELETKSIRRSAKISQSRRRPLLGPWKNHCKGWAAIKHYANQPTRPLWLGWIWWKILTLDWIKKIFFDTLKNCILGHWTFLNKMNFLKKCLFLPEKCIFLKKMAIWPPAQRSPAPMSRNFFFGR